MFLLCCGNLKGGLPALYNKHQNNFSLSRDIPCHPEHTQEKLTGIREFFSPVGWLPSSPTRCVLPTKDSIVGVKPALASLPCVPPW